MKIAVIKYNAGNIRSVAFALERLQVDYTITDRPEEIQQADKVIFPGVGEASTTMRYLKDHRLDELICSLKQPVLGICLGMQLMCKHSEENDTPCLGIFDETVRLFVPKHHEKVPHMGWNSLTTINDWLPSELKDQFVYFVHSFYAVPQNAAHCAGQTDYGGLFAAAIARDNIFATQFHPEKSADQGLALYRNFLSWNP